MAPLRSASAEASSAARSRRPLFKQFALCQPRESVGKREQCADHRDVEPVDTVHRDDHAPPVWRGGSRSRPLTDQHHQPIARKKYNEPQRIAYIIAPNIDSLLLRVAYGRLASRPNS